MACSHSQNASSSCAISPINLCCREMSLSQNQETSNELSEYTRRNLNTSTWASPHVIDLMGVHTVEATIRYQANIELMDLVCTLSILHCIQIANSKFRSTSKHHIVSHQHQRVNNPMALYHTRQFSRECVQYIHCNRSTWLYQSPMFSSGPYFSFFLCIIINVMFFHIMQANAYRIYLLCAGCHI